MLTLLLKAIQNLTRLGTIKSVQQAYQLAKRELGDQFNAAKKQIDDAFNQGKKEQTLDKRTKDIKKTEESGIKSLETEIDEDSIMGQINKSKNKLEEAANKLEKLQKEKDEFLRPRTDEEIAEKFGKKTTKEGFSSTPITDRLSKAVEEVKQQMKEIGSLSDADMQKKQIQDALRALRNRRIYEMGSGIEGDVRTALRQFVKKEVKEGRLDIPDAYEKKMILEDRQGGVDPIDVFRKAYGEDALIAVDDVFEQYGDRLKGPTFRDIEENFRKLFRMNRGFYDEALPVPKETYGFDEGLKSVDSVEEDLMKQYRQLDDLDRFSVKDRKPNAEGGIMRTSYAYGSGLKLAILLAKKGKTLKEEIRKMIDNIFPSGDSKYDADVVLDNVLEDLNIDRDAVDGFDISKAYGEAYDMLRAKIGLASKKVPGGMTPGSSDMDRLKELGAPKLAERFELKKRFPGIDDDLLTNIIDDPDPQHKAEVIATLEETFKMMQTGKGTDEIIDILEQGKKTRKDNATGGRAGFSIGGKEGIMQMASVDDPFYRSGEEDEHSFRMFNKPYKELNEDELEEFREEMMRLMNKFAGLTETDYLKVKDMLDHYHRYKAMPQRKGSKTKKIPKPDFAKEFFRENNATGGRVRAASGGLADILKV